MHLPFATLFLSSLSLLPLIASAHPHAISLRRERLPQSPSIVASRQFRVTRDLLDVCINANVNLLADASQLLEFGSFLGPLDLDAQLQLCLCLKDLNVYLETNDQIQALIDSLGKNIVGALITALINTSDKRKSCHFPQHSSHTCSSGDPCHYECDFPYVREGDSCVCPPPYSLCNGVCGTFSQGCGSALPPSLKKRSEPIVSLAQAESVCKSHESVCGIPGRERSLGFECIDTSSTKDSCGGCMTPHPFFEAEPILRYSGRDCSTIPNAKSTSCSENRCQILSCVDGWIPSAEKDACTTNSSLRKIRRTVNHYGKSSTGVQVDPEFFAKMTKLVDLFNKLSDDSSCLPPPPAAGSSNFGTSLPLTASTSINTELLNSLLNATANILNAGTDAEIKTSISSLSDSIVYVLDLVHQCDCTNVMGLGTWVADLEALWKIALDLQTWCHNYTIIPVPAPAVGSHSGQQSSPSTGLDLSDLLSGLQISSIINSGSTVNDLISQVVTSSDGLLNELIPGFSNQPIASSSLSSNINVTTGVNADLVPQIEAIVDSLLTLQGLVPSSDLMTKISQAVIDLLQSANYGSLLSNIDNLIDAETALNSALEGYSDDSLEYLEMIIDDTLALKEWCGSHNVFASPSSSTLHLAPHTGIGHTSTLTVITTIHRITSTTVAAHSIFSSSPTRSVTSHPVISQTPLPTSGADIPTVIGLDHLLEAPGLGKLKAVVTIDGLGNDLDNLINDDLDELAGIGPHGVRRRELEGARGQQRRQVDANVNATIDVDLDGLLDTLIGLVLGMDSAATTTLPSIQSSAPKPGSSETSVGNVDSCLTNNVVSALNDLLSTSTYANLIPATQNLVGATLTSLKTLDGCSCMEDLGLGEIYGYLDEIWKASTQLLDWCRDHPDSTLPSRLPVPAITPTSSEGGSPSVAPSNVAPSPSGTGSIVIGLSKLAQSLHIPIKSVTGVDGPADDVDSALDGLLGIGLTGARRYFVQRNYTLYA